jgi:hypothetical protein
MSADERAELERLRAEAAASPGSRWARAGRWTAACALLLVAALLGVLAVTAVYLKSEVLDTETYVQTVTPLAENTAVREALANRLTEEIVTRTDVAALATQVARRLVAEGAPARVNDLVGPAVSGLTSFLHSEVYRLLGTAQFQDIWEQVNRQAHAGVVTVLTGGQGQFIASKGTTVTIDLGALLSAAKQRLVAGGISIASKVPAVSIKYELVDSAKLPTVRTYTRVLNSAGTWLPFVALAVLLAGVLVAPNRRRGLLTGVVMLGLAAALTLGGLAVARTYYLDNLPQSVRSPDAAAAVADAILRYLIAALQTLLVVAAVVVVGTLLAGPSRPAHALRRLVNQGLDAAGRGLARAGSWVAAVGRTLAGARGVIQIVLVLAAVVALILVNRPGVAAVLWTTLAVLVLCGIVEIFIRGARAMTA